VILEVGREVCFLNYGLNASAASDTRPLPAHAPCCSRVGAGEAGGGALAPHGGGDA
jgi:hypothetical protein